MFTATGKLKAGASAAPVVQLDHQTPVATALVATLRERLSAFESASNRIENLRQAAERAQRREQEVMATLAGTRGKSHEYLEVSGRCQTLRQELGAAKAKADDARYRLEQIATARKDLADDEAKLARLQTEHPPLETTVKECAARELEARTHASSVRTRRREIDVARAAAHDAQALSDASRRRPANLGAERHGRRGAASTGATPRAADPDRVAHAEATGGAAQGRERRAPTLACDWRRRWSRLLSRLRSGSKSSRWWASRPATTWWSPAQRLVIRGSPETALYLPGVGTIRAIGPATSAKQLRAELASAEAQHHRLAIVFGEVPLEQLEELQAQAQQLEGQIAQWQTRVSTTLDGKTIEQLRFELALADRTRSRNLARQAGRGASRRHRRRVACRCRAVGPCVPRPRSTMPKRKSRLPARSRCC